VRWTVLGAVVVALIALPAAALLPALVELKVGRVTVVENADGTERTVHWRDYPGVADIDSQEVLDGPSAEEAYAAAEAMVAEMRAAITAEFGLEWADPPPRDEAFSPFHDNVQNWYGGTSMLTTINAEGSSTTSVPTTWEDKQRLLDIVARIAADHGYSAPVLDTEGAQWTDEDMLRDLGGTTPETQAIVGGSLHGPTGQWVFFVFQDMSKDLDGSIAERLSPSTDAGWPLNTFSIGYGANGLLHQGDEAEFERRLQPFEGLRPPEPLET
jgi:hypothetical protein